MYLHRSEANFPSFSLVLLLDHGRAATHMEETAQERLWKASKKGDVATVRTLLESGHVDVNADKVRSLLVFRPRMCLPSGFYRDAVGGLTHVYAVLLTHASSVWNQTTSLCVIRRSFGSRGVASRGRR